MVKWCEKYVFEGLDQSVSTFYGCNVEVKSEEGGVVGKTGVMCFGESK